MPRYTTQPRSGDDDDIWFPKPMLPPIAVCESVPVNTGLVDHRGAPIMRLPEPLGFHRARG